MKRILTALLLLPVLIALVWIKEPLYFDILLLLVGTLASIEYLKILKGLELQPPFYIVVLSTLLLLLSFIVPYAEREMLLVAILFFTMLYFILSKIDMRKAFLSLSASIFGIIYISFLLGYIVLLKGNGGERGKDLVLLLLFTVWLGDCFALYIGSAFGKHALAQSISPKKTWEGAIGSMLGTLVAGITASFTFIRILTTRDIIIITILISITGQVGDLGESIIKRAGGIKDSAFYLPGHGGFLDRIDSLLFAAPVTYYYYTWFMK